MARIRSVWYSPLENKILSGKIDHATKEKHTFIQRRKQRITPEYSPKMEGEIYRKTRRDESLGNQK
jgi:hypothetical protein